MMLRTEGLPQRLVLSLMVTEHDELRAAECATLESRARTIPLPKSKATAKPKPKVSAKAKAAANASADDNDDEPKPPKNRRGSVRTKK